MTTATAAPRLGRPTIGTFEGVFTKVHRAADGLVYWQTTCSDDGVDLYGTRMTTDLFDDFILNSNVRGLPVLTVSHFYGLSTIGRTTELWRQGRRLKAKGHFLTNSDDDFTARLATAAADAALAEQNNMVRLRRIRTSIGFYPEMAEGEDLGIVAYTRGYLPEITMTTHPANSRADFLAQEDEGMTKRALDPKFMTEDATSIVGESLAAELAERFQKINLRSGKDGADPVELLYRAFAATPDKAERKVKARAWLGTLTPEQQKRVAVTLKVDTEDLDEMSGLLGELAEAFDDLLIDNLAGGEDAPEDDAGMEQMAKERIGKKLQGKKLAELSAAITAAEATLTDLKAIQTWAAGPDSQEGPASADNGLTGTVAQKSVDLGDRAFTSGTAMQGKSIDLDTLKVLSVIRSTEDGLPLGPGASLVDVALMRISRYMEIEPDSSIEQVQTYQSMCMAASNILWTMQDIIMANLDPGDPDDPGEPVLTLQDRMTNIQNSMTEAQGMINNILMLGFGGGRSIEDDPAADNSSVNNDKGAATGIKGRAGGDDAINDAPAPSRRSGPTPFDQASEKVRQLLLGKNVSAETLQAALDEQNAAAVDALPPDQRPAVDDAALARIAGLEIGLSQIMARLEEIAEQRSTAPTADTAPANPYLPRRRSLRPIAGPAPSPQVSERSQPPDPTRGVSLKEAAQHIGRRADFSRYP